MRWLPLLLAGTALAAADYRFAPGRTQHYRSETTQTVGWTTAGERLAFTTTIAADQAWTCTGGDAATAVIEVTTTGLTASHQGPGSDHQYASGSSRRDPLLGHLAALEHSVLRLTVDRRSGAVTVSGGEAIVRRIAEAAPNAIDPAAPSPLAAGAAQTYGDAALGRLWSQILARPTGQPQAVPLGPPLSGALTRTWNGDAYTLSGMVSEPVSLVREPSAVSAVVEAVGGEGRSTLAGDGWPQRLGGTLTFTLAVSALTQPVRQEHRVTWSLTRTDG